MIRNAIWILAMSGVLIGGRFATAEPAKEAPAATAARLPEQKVRKEVPVTPRDRATEMETGVTKAVALLLPVGDSKVTGVVIFEKKGNGVHIRGEIEGLKPGKHGFHIHQFGDLTDRKEGKSAGDHFNPTHEKHGRPDAKSRHAGDFGNIETDQDGHTRIDIKDAQLHMQGPHSILGRGLVVHAEEDKFTQPSGDAGSRVAVGVIGIANTAMEK